MRAGSFARGSGTVNQWRGMDTLTAIEAASPRPAVAAAGNAVGVVDGAAGVQEAAASARVNTCARYLKVR